MGADTSRNVKKKVLKCYIVGGADRTLQPIPLGRLKNCKKL